ncbi:MAG: glycoside hydrolase [Candidatus Dactylopiibacterium carminicum]|nr:MAG: glycoside hydrolase [Candidatus Dactylopiibacterium carminicum]
MHYIAKTARGGPSVSWSSSMQQQPSSSPSDPWDQVPAILARIQPPTIPARDFRLDVFGAVGDGVKDCTEAFRAAIAAASEADGGRIVVPAGDWLTGPIHLRSNIELHVAEGATVRFRTDAEAYLPMVLTRWEGVELYNYSPLIYAFECENVAITGSGTLGGQGSNDTWWKWRDKVKFGWQPGTPQQKPARLMLFILGEHDVPVEARRFGEGYWLRPNMIQPYRCRNILIEGVTIRNSPMWHIHCVLSQNITIRKVTVIGHGPETDGANPESCRDVLIEDCYFDTGDDCIAIKSGRNGDGRRINVPSENIIVRNCVMRDGHGAIVIGSELTGGVRNVFAENLEMDSRNLDRALRIKTNSHRGGLVENIHMRNSVVKSLGGEVVQVNLDYEEGDTGKFTPIVRHIHVDNLVSQGGKIGLQLKAYERSPVQDVRITNCRFDGVEQPFELRHTQDLHLANVTINGITYNGEPEA